MAELIKQIMLILSSSLLVLLVRLPAIASQPINPGQLNSQAVGLSQQWRDSRGTLVVDESLTRRDSRSLTGAGDFPLFT